MGSAQNYPARPEGPPFINQPSPGNGRGFLVFWNSRTTNAWARGGFLVEGEILVPQKPIGSEFEWRDFAWEPARLPKSGERLPLMVNLLLSYRENSGPGNG